MKRNKNKLSDKIKSLKDNISLPEIDPLDEEINFEKEERTEQTSKADGIELAGDVSTSVMSQAESTSVIAQDDDYDNRTAVSVSKTSPTQITDINDESTFRDARADMENEKVSYGDVYETENTHGGAPENVGGLLKQVEHLRLAQSKINELEGEIEDLRRENDELLSAADTFKVLSEEYYEQLEKMKNEFLEARETANQENKILKESLNERERQNHELKQSNADLKAKVETNFKQIRKRERDLEYRLEMAKVEETTLLKSKDKSILELRRKIDKLEQEMEAYREKNKEHYQKLQLQQQTVRGVVRALRIALTRLEGDFGVDFEVLKKAE
jgi:DNA repair exonuclease SbcCD ATPase subunit